MSIQKIFLILEGPHGVKFVGIRISHFLLGLERIACANMMEINSSQIVIKSFTFIANKTKIYNVLYKDTVTVDYVWICGIKDTFMWSAWHNK